jgi:hypothetical protein
MGGVFDVENLTHDREALVALVARGAALVKRWEDSCERAAAFCATAEGAMERANLGLAEALSAHRLACMALLEYDEHAKG